MTSIEEKNSILKEHDELEKEYNKLCNSNDLLTSKQWQEREERKKAILIRIDKLKAIENAWDSDVKEPDLNTVSLQMLTIKDVSQLLNCGRDQVRMYIEVGILHPIKTGKNYMFVPDDILEFQRTYKGLDMSNRKQALLNYHRLNEV